MLIQPDYVGLTRRSPHRITLRVYGCGSLLIRPDYVGLTRRSPHRITLRVYGCGSLLAHICVDHAYSFLSTLCMLKNCLRVDVSYIKKQSFPLQGRTDPRYHPYSRNLYSGHSLTL